MQWKMFCQIKTVVTVLFGAIFLAVPALFWSLFGFDSNAHADLLTRMLGIIYVSTAFTIFSMRDLSPSTSRKQTAVTMGTTDLVTACLLVVATIQAVINPLGWVLVAAYVIFGSAWFVLK